MKRKLNKRKVKSAIKERGTEELKLLMMNWQSPEIADLIYHLPALDKAFVFTTLPYIMVIKTFKVLDISSQKEIIKNLPHEQAAKILNEIQPDDRTQFLSELPSILVKDLLQLLSEEERIITLNQLNTVSDD
jgi:magnesium transporter